ncbi:hypothetical protein HUJ05_009219 [Dendroctonus ponderosae]|nr:hypothetical protein HUJ05_009219 [Dendroctonus ponderosae]
MRCDQQRSALMSIRPPPCPLLLHLQEHEKILNICKIRNNWQVQGTPLHRCGQSGRKRVKVLECSAKDDINIKEIFRSLLTLSKLLPRKDPSDTGTGLKRRSSAYVSATSKDRRRAESPLLEADKASGSGSGCLEGIQPSKPRSRSLIRRASRKTKQQIRDAQVNECNVS